MAGEAAPALQDAAPAILAGGVVGIIAIFSDQYVQFAGQALTANIVTMSVFGAIVMYIISISRCSLRKTEPGWPCPFRAPLYPFFPGFSLVAAIVCLLTMIYYNREVALLFAAFMALGLLPDDQGRRKDDAAELLEEAVRPE